MGLLIVWQIFHVVTQGSGGKSASTGASNHSSSAAPPSPRPTPAPTVTLGGHKVSAGGGPLIVLNPGLASAGGHVGVEGSGFTPKEPVVISLRTSRLRSKVVGHGKASLAGILTSGFTMPSSLTGRTATVVAQQSGGKVATAPLTTPGGVGSVTIVGKAAGKPGDTVSLSASGFGPGEKVNVYWGRLGGTPATTLTADSGGSIGRASVRVGVAPVGPTSLVLIGEKTRTTATAPYQMLGLYPNTTTHPYAAKAGKAVTFNGGGFAPGEQVLIYLNASSGLPALTSNASSNGSFSVHFVLPFGLRGGQRLTAIGAQSRASVTSGFDVLPYSPTAQASTYGALPGTTVSFYASGYAANEVVLVYLGGGRGSSGQLVTAFRVDGHGSAAAAGKYVVPSGVGPAIHFNLVGQKSRGVAGAKISVTASSQPVTIPSQPPYVLPPSLGGKPARSVPSGSPGATSPSGSSSTSSGPQPSQGSSPGSPSPGPTASSP